MHLGNLERKKKLVNFEHKNELALYRSY